MTFHEAKTRTKSTLKLVVIPALLVFSGQQLISWLQKYLISEWISLAAFRRTVTTVSTVAFVAEWKKGCNLVISKWTHFFDETKSNRNPIYPTPNPDVIPVKQCWKECRYININLPLSTTPPPSSERTAHSAFPSIIKLVRDKSFVTEMRWMAGLPTKMKDWPPPRHTRADCSS